MLEGQSLYLSVIFDTMSCFAMFSNFHTTAGSSVGNIGVFKITKIIGKAWHCPAENQAVADKRNFIQGRDASTSTKDLAAASLPW